MFYKCFKCKSTVKPKYVLFGPIGVFLHYKIQVHYKESFTIALCTPIVFKEIKVLLHYELQLHSQKSMYYCIIYYKCIQGIKVSECCKLNSKKENTIVI